MSRPLRIEYPGAVYHVLSRGNARQDIFRDNRDRKRFLERLSRAVSHYHFIVHAYCLMGNHYHLVVETPEGNLSMAIRQVNGPYAQYFNSRHRTVGHLFQGRFKAALVEKEEYLLELCRYVVLNPVRAGVADLPSEWEWSSYPATIGRREVPDFLEVEWLLALFSEHDRREAQRRYEAFVLRGMRDAAALKKEAMFGKPILGTSTFIERFREVLKEKAPLAEIPRRQRFVSRPPLNALFHGVQEKNQLRFLMHKAHVQHGYLKREIADHLGIHYSTVSKGIWEAENCHFKT
jgi:putative transposase